MDGQVQEFDSLCSYMQQFNPDQFLEAVSDFHLLLFIATMDMLPLKVNKRSIASLVDMLKRFLI